MRELGAHPRSGVLRRQRCADGEEGCLVAEAEVEAPISRGEARLACGPSLQEGGLEQSFLQSM